MTFTTFDSFTKWCKNVEELDVLDNHPEKDQIILQNLQDTDTLVVIEALISAYDSGFHFGAYFAKQDGGSLVIYEG